MSSLVEKGTAWLWGLTAGRLISITSKHCHTGSFLFCVGTGSQLTWVLVEHSAKEKSHIWAVQFTPDDKCLATGGSDGRIKVLLLFSQYAFRVSLPSLSRYGVFQRSASSPRLKGIHPLSSLLKFLQMADFLFQVRMTTLFASGVCVMGWQRDWWAPLCLVSSPLHSVRMDT